MRAIKCTCSHCQRETYFDVSAGIGLRALAASRCKRCGERGAVITLNIDAPRGMPLEELRSSDDLQREESLLAT